MSGGGRVCLNEGVDDVRCKDGRYLFLPLRV